MLRWQLEWTASTEAIQETANVKNIDDTISVNSFRPRTDQCA